MVMVNSMRLLPFLPCSPPRQDGRAVQGAGSGHSLPWRRGFKSHFRQHSSWGSLVAQMVTNLSAMWESVPDLIPGSGRSSGEGNGNPLPYPCLENLRDRGAWWAAVHEAAAGRTRPCAWRSPGPGTESEAPLYLAGCTAPHSTSTCSRPSWWRTWCPAAAWDPP